MYVMFMGKLLLMTSPVFNKCRQAMFNNFQCWIDASYFQNKVMSLNPILVSAILCH